MEGAEWPGDGTVEGGTSGAVVAEQGRDGGSEPSVGRAESGVEIGLVGAVTERWPARAKASCRAAMWVALERKRGMG